MDEIVLEINDNGASERHNEQVKQNEHVSDSEGSSATQNTKTTTLSAEEESQLRKQAEDEWAEVERLQQERDKQGLNTSTSSSNSKSTLIDFEEAWNYFQNECDLSEEKKTIITSDERNAGCLGLCGPPKFKNSLIQERNNVFATAHVAFNNENQLHLRILQTIYRLLTGLLLYFETDDIQGAQFDCPRFGNHWDTIGFQGTDPATDLRGVGMLGLLQILYFVKKHRKIAEEMYVLSRHEFQNFPLCLVGISLCKVVVESLREGRLTKLCNSKNSICNVINEFHSAIMKRQNKSIKDYGFVLKDVTKRGKNQPEKMMQEMIKAEENLKKGIKGNPEEKIEKIDFSNID